MAENFDIDALLAGAVGSKDKSKQQNTPATKNDFNSELNTNFGSGFKIDPRDSHITGTDELRRDSNAVIVDPKDFRNQVQVTKRKNEKRKLYLILSFGLFFLLLGAVVFFAMPKDGGNALAQPKPVGDTSAQRFLALWPEAPKPNTTIPFGVTAFEDGLLATAGYDLIFAGMDFETNTYQATTSTAFGKAAVAQVPGEWEGTEVYIFKDMAHSRAFESAWDGDLAEVEGSPASAIMHMEFPDGVHAVLAVVAPDSSGYMIVLPLNLNLPTALNLAASVRLEPSRN